MELGIFGEFSLIVVIAALMAGLARLFRQPVVIGHIITGLLVGPVVFDLISSRETINLFSELGIAFLLFVVGLHLKPAVIKELGKVSLVTGVGQVIFTSLVGFFLAFVLGFDGLSSLFIAIALTFSSTIIILKFLSDKNELETLHGRISIGFLLVQDVLAVIALILLAAGNSGLEAGDALIDIIIKGFLAGSILLILGRGLLPSLSRFFAGSTELLFLFSIAWGLGIATMFAKLGFTVEIGALAAGIALSSSPYSVEIASRLKPLRDFFIVLFFIILGTQLSFAGGSELFWPALLLSVFVLVGNPLIMLILMGLLGYRRQVSFLSGLAVAQISEFSLILVLLGVEQGHISQEVLTLVTLVGLITITGSTYLFKYSHQLYKFFASYLKIFEKKVIHNNANQVKKNDFDIIIFGLHRMGKVFLEYFRAKKVSLLAVDYNPQVISELTKQNIAAVYGDAGDPDFLLELQFSQTKLVISSVPGFDANLLLIEQVRAVNSQAVIIVLSHDYQETEDLYKAGASFVIMPHFISVERVLSLLDEHGFKHSNFKAGKEKLLEFVNKQWQSV